MPMRHAASGDCSKTPAPRSSALMWVLRLAVVLAVGLGVLGLAVFVVTYAAKKGWGP